MRTINRRSCPTIPSMFISSMGEVKEPTHYSKRVGREVSRCCGCPLCCSFWVGASHRVNLMHHSPLDRIVQWKWLRLCYFNFVAWSADKVSTPCDAYSNYVISLCRGVRYMYMSMHTAMFGSLVISVYVAGFSLQRYCVLGEVEWHAYGKLWGEFEWCK